MSISSVSQSYGVNPPVAIPTAINVKAAPEAESQPEACPTQLPLRSVFMAEFDSVGFSSPQGPQRAVQNLAQKYYEIRNGLMNQYSGEALYEQLSELNMAFERALLRAATTFPEAAHTPETQEFLRALEESNTKNYSEFFENFINRIQTQDFHDAFNTSWSEAVSDFSFRLNPFTMRRVQVSVGNSYEMLFVSPEGVWRLPSGGNSRKDLEKIDTSRGTPGIAQSTIRTLEMTARLLNHMPVGTSVGPVGIEVHIERLAEAFAAVRQEIDGQSQQHSRFLEDAFRNEVRRAFEINDQSQHMGIGRGMANVVLDPEEMAQVRAEAASRADMFVNIFLSGGSLSDAWAAVVISN